jgi:hypothetical protein
MICRTAPQTLKPLAGEPSGEIAANLRAADEAEAAFDHPELAVLSDEELLRRACTGDRAVVTENARDFDRIVRS